MSEAIRRTFFTADAKFSVEKPEGSTGPGTLRGYALVWNTLSTDRGGYKVRLAPDSARFTTPARALYQHNPAAVIGNTANGTLRLTSDDIGVHFEIDLPDTTTGRDVAELVGKEYVAGMSFSMLYHPEPKGQVVTEDKEKIFNAEEFTVDEITVTGNPAFLDTSVRVKEADPLPELQRAVPQSHSTDAKVAERRERSRFKALQLSDAAEIAE